MDERRPTVDKAVDETNPTSEALQTAKYDNFFTPQNREFYSKFRYVSFKPEERRIRLLRIKPLDSGEDERSPIKCDLIDDQLLSDIKDKYATISYCAGDPKKTAIIFVNGLEFNAFANLGHALRQARHFWKEKFGAQELLLWADQVCIDQSNSTERSHQVSFMADIYESAVQVLVCLSNEGSRSGGIQWLQQFVQVLRKKGWTSPDKHYVSHRVMDLIFKFLLETCYEKSFHRGWDIFLDTVIKSPWWSRAWIRQELLRSQDAYFLAANESGHWSMVAEGLRNYFEASGGFVKSDYKNRLNRTAWSRPCSVGCQACVQIGKSVDMWEFRSVAKKLIGLKEKNCMSDLLENLEDVHLCKASDPRDLVYASIGISKHGYDIRPDYALGLSFEDVLTQLARNVISRNQSLAILRYAYMTRAWMLDGVVPSWVPYWSNESRTYAGHLYPLPSRTADFFTFHADAQGHPGRILQVRGVFVKTIDGKSDCLVSRTRLHDRILPLVGDTTGGDEIYSIHGLGNLFVFRRQSAYYKVVGEVLGREGVLPDVGILVDNLEKLVERNDSAVVCINIC